MKLRAIYIGFLCLTFLSALGFAADHEYQTGKIIKVEQQDSRSSSGGTDATLKAAVSTYRISLQLGDKVYVVQYKTDPENDISWAEGKEVQARVSGKVIYVKKVTGKEVRGSILSTAPAGQ